MKYQLEYTYMQLEEVPEGYENHVAELPDGCIVVEFTKQKSTHLDNSYFMIGYLKPIIVSTKVSEEVRE